jgi:dethiobiotin synthetase
MRSIIVTGTDTGVGKTTVAAALARSVRSKGINVGVMKPFAASKKRYSDKYRSEDTAILAEAAGVDDCDHEINPFFYSLPSAPFVAASITSETPITIMAAVSSLEKLKTKHDFLIIEGIGGLMVPLTEKETFADFAKVLNAPILVVASCKIGIFNHILLTLHASRNYGLRTAGLVLNSFPCRPGVVDRQLVDAVRRLCDIELIFTLPRLRRNRQSQLGLEDKILDKILAF